MKNISELSVETLEKAATLKKQINALQKELENLILDKVEIVEVKGAKARKPFSPEIRQKMREAQQKRRQAEQAQKAAQVTPEIVPA